jgi:hypothetical protein
METGKNKSGQRTRVPSENFPRTKGHPTCRSYEPPFFEKKVIGTLKLLDFFAGFVIGLHAAIYHRTEFHITRTNQCFDDIKGWKPVQFIYLMEIHELIGR